MFTDLVKLPLFQDLSPADLKLIEPYFTAGNFIAGEKLFSQGDLADMLYLITVGELIIKYKPYDAPEITLTHVRKDDVLGWSTVLGNTSYTSSVICKTDVSALLISGGNLRKLVADHPETGKIIMDRLAMAVSPRWRDAQNQVKAMLEKGMDL